MKVLKGLEQVWDSVIVLSMGEYTRLTTEAAAPPREKYFMQFKMLQKYSLLGVNLNCVLCA